MKTKILSMLVSAFMLVALYSCGSKSNQEDSKEIAQDQNEEKFEDSKLEDDTEFAVNAASSSMAEVELSQLAVTKAQSPKVKEFAQMMIDDHSKANQELKALAQQKNITLPDSMGNKHQDKYQDLTEKQGQEFDQEYMDIMVENHKEVIDKFEDQAEEGNDGELKSWAAEKLPALQHHLEMAQATQDAVKNNNSSTNN